MIFNIFFDVIKRGVSRVKTVYHGIIIIYIYPWFKGVYKCRAGWASLEQPQLVFKNITAKQKGKKVKHV